MRQTRSLTTRLIAITVLLVAVTTLLIGAATALAMREQLSHQLDAEVKDTLSRTLGGADGHEGPDDERGDFGPGQQIGAIRAVYPDSGTAQGQVLSEKDGPGWTASTALTAPQLAALRAAVDGTGRHWDVAQTVRLPHLGNYRVIGKELSDGLVIAGLPMARSRDTINDLIRLEMLAGLLGVAGAGVLALVVVRRQLAPLRAVAGTAHRVAQQPLSSGEIELHDRVPEHLTDPRTEIGQVGAALNTLLDHVEVSLVERHRSEQQVRQFVADASHELRTPLATIKGYAELARRRPDDAQAAQTALDRVEAASGRMSGLVEDLLLLARLDSGRPLEATPVDLSMLAVEGVSDARVLAPDHRWQLDLPDESVEVTGDALRLHQVLSNLLTNARRYTPPGTTVTVRVRPGEFSVHDDGPGFEEGLAARAFERFVRGDESRTRQADEAASGAGLGLSLVEAITKAHGGTVTLDSRPGDTTIRVTFPR